MQPNSSPTIEVISPSLNLRDELIGFLSHFENETRSEEFWRQRLAYWWEKNPAFDEQLPMGWIIRDKAEIVGFLGSITSLYVYDKKNYPALNMTTWRVAKEQR